MVCTRVAVVVTAAVLVVVSIALPLATAVPRPPGYVGSLPVPNAEVGMTFGMAMAANTRFLAVGAPFYSTQGIVESYYLFVGPQFLLFLFYPSVCPYLVGRVDLYSISPTGGMTHVTTMVSSVGSSSEFGLAVSLDDADLLIVSETGISDVGIISVFKV